MNYNWFIQHIRFTCRPHLITQVTFKLDRWANTYFFTITISNSFRHRQRQYTSPGEVCRMYIKYTFGIFSSIYGYSLLNNKTFSNINWWEFVNLPVIIQCCKLYNYLNDCAKFHPDRIIENMIMAMLGYPLEGFFASLRML